MISVPVTSRAAAIATSDLPDAVGASTTTGDPAMSERDDRDARAVRRRGEDLAQLAREVVRRGAGDLDRRVRAGPQRGGRGEVHEAVLGRAGGEDGAVLLARSLDEDLFGAPD